MSEDYILLALTDAVRRALSLAADDEIEKQKRLEAIKRLEWFLGVSKVVDSITLVGDDKECFEMAAEALREKEFKEDT